ncbi:ABC transporter ATP-binding protein [Candidatus Hecatella orcuttiae]|uniref:ABC transporter ATP-binding protein n=1 Tax=Candidatus Hecatella orcuttiae TaxID=1935119 RepID=UPI00286800C7|nr:ABC transporter ATP-binding protein [Candidatus Hecatella orcuttiae]
MANDHVDFDLREGEIHGLLGENGAGKTTLMKILYGLYQPDEGYILLRGKRFTSNSPKEAIRNGIGFVQQHFSLVPSFDAVENVMIGLKSAGLFSQNVEEVRSKIAELSEKYGLKVDSQTKIWQLSVGEQQRVEIIKALCMGTRALILDEPTSVLTPQETVKLFETLRLMVKQGFSIVFITHKLEEVMSVADRITVLRAGKVVFTCNKDETNKAELARMMVGREVIFRPEREELGKGKVILEVKDLHALNDKGLEALRGVSLYVRQGEILGIAGVAGNGQSELAEVITGLRKASGGKVFLKGQDITGCSPRERIDLGLAHIPEDRVNIGLVTSMSVLENLILKNYRSSDFNRGLFIDRQAVEHFCDRLISSFNIMTPARDTPVKLLSGGNQQRLLLAREISASPEVLVAVHPTSGLDVGATEYIQRMLLEQRRRGVAILLISEDLDEIMALSDRIAVMYQGKIVGTVEAKAAQREEVGLMMAGGK